MNVSALLQPKALTQIQAKTILDEIVAEFRRVDNDLTALRRKCLTFQQGKGWEPLGYPSLKACLDKVFGFSEQRFYQLTAAAEIEKDIGIDSTGVEPPPSEGVLRPLKKIDRGQRAKVFQAAVRLAEEENDERPIVTERHTKAAVKQVENLAGNGQETSEKVILLRDGKGNTVEEPQLREAFEARAEVTSILSGITALGKRFDALIERYGDLAYTPRIVRGAQAGWRAKLRDYAPYVPCPHCRGQRPDECDKCEGRGYWTKVDYTAANK